MKNIIRLFNKITLGLIISILFFLPISTVNAQEAQCVGMEAGDECTAGNYTIRYNSIDEFGNRKFTVKQVNIGFDNRYIDSPYLTDYLSVMYKYVVMAITIMSTIVMIFAGILWLTSAGNPEQISRAKKMITRSITGLILSIGSYTILWTINPQLVEFSSLKILRVQDITLEQGLNVTENWTPLTNTGNLDNPEYDQIFKNYASCVNIDWRILKGIAFMESGLDTNFTSETGFIGLFQTKKVYCENILRNRNWSDKCNSLKDPNNNTALGMATVDMAIKRIDEHCPNSTTKDKLSLIYLIHNTGIGAITDIMKAGGCTEPTIAPLILAYWQKKGQTNSGELRHNYAKKVADTIIGLGVTSLKASKEGICPQ